MESIADLVTSWLTEYRYPALALGGYRGYMGGGFGPGGFSIGQHNVSGKPKGHGSHVRVQWDHDIFLVQDLMPVLNMAPLSSMLTVRRS